MTTITPIGFVRNNASFTDKPGLIKQGISQIEIIDKYEKGLINITAHEYITVVFGLNLINEVHLIEKRKPKGEWGIFACRSQYRPNHIGVTNCKLLKCEGNIITVQGLDACNNSPVYDLKCPDTSEDEQRMIHNKILLKNPRHDIDYELRNDLYYPLVIKAAQLTGNITTNLKLGVIAGIDFVNQIKNIYGYYDVNSFQLIANCHSDIAKGANFVSGASLVMNNTFDNTHIQLVFIGKDAMYLFHLNDEKSQFIDDADPLNINIWDIKIVNFNYNKQE